LGKWDAPAGGKLEVAGAPSDGSLAPFSVTPPEPYSAEDKVFVSAYAEVANRIGRTPATTIRFVMSFSP